jgi:Tfp pilus assembly ATPase PilU
MIQTGRAQGMIGLDQALAELVVNDVVDVEEAFEKSLDKDQFRSLVQKRKTVKQSAVMAPAVRRSSTTAAPAAGG